MVPKGRSTDLVLPKERSTDLVLPSHREYLPWVGQPANGSALITLYEKKKEYFSFFIFFVNGVYNFEFHCLF
ncbi:Uncharacterized protein TCM_017028 [Theobroma cacao]|uniref:Uncharacterized protein n=1 Tax=Theobroma cacao TaxID=3641 RepID=A0A061ED91_THECC|nr:Uncharacterized protein TCM_017028 [Theobroma cacao]